MLHRLYHLLHDGQQPGFIDAEIAMLLDVLNLKIGTEHDLSEIMEQMCECLLKSPDLEESRRHFRVTQKTSLESLQACNCTEGRGIHVTNTTNHTAVYSSALQTSSLEMSLHIQELTCSLQSAVEEVDLEYKCETCNTFLMHWRATRSDVVIGHQFLWRLHREGLSHTCRVVMQPTEVISSRTFWITGVGEYLGHHYMAYIREVCDGSDTMTASDEVLDVYQNVPKSLQRRSCYKNCNIIRLSLSRSPGRDCLLCGRRVTQAPGYERCREYISEFLADFIKQFAEDAASNVRSLI